MILKWYRLYLGFLTLAILLGGSDLSWSQQAEEEAIDTLDVIEIEGTAVNMEMRQFVYPEPDIHAPHPFSRSE